MKILLEYQKQQDFYRKQKKRNTKDTGDNSVAK